MRGFLGVDAYRVLNGAWLVANLLFGLGFIVAALWLSRQYGDRMERHPVIQRLMKELAGYNLKAAESFLATLSEFEDEERAD
jgi:flagellar biogenesis protein FliO